MESTPARQSTSMELTLKNSKSILQVRVFSGLISLYFANASQSVPGKLRESAL